MNGKWFCLLIGASLVLVQMARADEAAFVTDTQEARPNYLAIDAKPAPEQPAEPFAKGTWALQFTGSYISGSDASLTDSLGEGGSGNVGVGYFLFKNVGVYGELVGYGFDKKDWTGDDAWGGGLNMLLRWHFLSFDRWSIYADGGGGIIEFEDEFPSGGTHFNFTGRVGLGASIRLAHNLHLIGGARYLHISNAAIHGVERNPGFDSMEYYTGLMFTF